MLYFGAMKAKAGVGIQIGVLPEAVQMSVGDAMRLNKWAPVAVMVAFVSRLLLRDPALEGWQRAGTALLPLLPSCLYLRSLVRWIGGLDEMQRELQVRAMGFALLLMLGVHLTLDLLQIGGFLRDMHLGWEGVFALSFFFYALGLARANRGYR